MPTLISSYVREQARLALDPVISDDPASSYFTFLGKVMTPDQYPMFCRLITDETATASIGCTEEDFEFGLNQILSGLAHTVRAGTAAAGEDG